MTVTVTLENKLDNEVTEGVPDGAGTVIVRVEEENGEVRNYFMPTLEDAEELKARLEV